MSLSAFAFSRFVVLAGLAAWLSVAALNNLVDPGTNRLHIGNTLSMALLREEAVLGASLRWRAWPADWAKPLLYGIAIVQSLIALCLWRAATTYATAWRQRNSQLLNLARNRSVVALTCFLLLWLGFLCGGIWFGYWMKQGAIQSVHMSLVLISLAALIFIQTDFSPAMASPAETPPLSEIS